ncbi:porin family protein [Thermonema rossianum]|uniref:porin family protein n=1 Tax=Thermonema rossianum TaxID=55505 RepID=UPI00056E6B99|nr:porin family protein [Thermonema rossianum]
MKKLLLTLAAGALFFGAQAQISIMPKAGVSLASTAYKSAGESDKTDMKTGFAFGVAAPISVSDQFSVQPELLYIQKGGEEKSNGLTSSATINYLEIPVMARAHFGGFYVGAGPYLGIALGGKAKIDDGSASIEADLNIGTDEAEDDVKPTDFGMYFGLGYGFEVGSGKLVLDARYGLGLSNIQPGGDSDNFSKNRNIAITVGYAIPLGQ